MFVAIIVVGIESLTGSIILLFQRVCRSELDSQSLDIRLELLTNPQNKQRLEDCILKESFQCDTPVLVDPIDDFLEFFGMKRPRSASMIDEISNKSIKAVVPVDAFDIIPCQSCFLSSLVMLVKSVLSLSVLRNISDSAMMDCFSTSVKAYRVVQGRVSVLGLCLQSQ